MILSLLTCHWESYLDQLPAVKHIEGLPEIKRLNVSPGETAAPEKASGAQVAAGNFDEATSGIAGERAPRA